VAVIAVYLLDSSFALVVCLFMIGVLVSIQVCGAVITPFLTDAKSRGHAALSI
jgi:hypothetical protein